VQSASDPGLPRAVAERLDLLDERLISLEIGLTEGLESTLTALGAEFVRRLDEVHHSRIRRITAPSRFSPGLRGRLENGRR
jgi:hypothetical protein